MPENRPYAFELGAILYRETAAGQTTNIRDVAADNGVSAEQLDRAAAIIARLDADGQDIDEFIRREYVIDGMLNGYVPLDASLRDPTLSTWTLSQHADNHYSRQPS